MEKKAIAKSCRVRRYQCWMSLISIFFNQKETTPPLSWRLFPSSFDRLFPLTSASNWPRPKKTTKADAKVHSSTFISCHPIAAERGIVRLYPVRPKKRNKKSGLAFTNPDFSGPSVIIGLGKIQSYQWFASSKRFLSENSTSMQVLPIALRQHFYHEIHRK